MDGQTAFIPIDRAAAQLGVPASWLRAEAEAKRVSALRAGKSLLVNLETIQEELSSRAKSQVAHA